MRISFENIYGYCATITGAYSYMLFRRVRYLLHPTNYYNLLPPIFYITTQETTALLPCDT